jgi:hypothetical protein
LATCLPFRESWKKANKRVLEDYPVNIATHGAGRRFGRRSETELSCGIANFVAER